MKDVESCNGKLSVSGQSVHNRSYGQDTQPISSFVLAFRNSWSQCSDTTQSSTLRSLKGVISRPNPQTHPLICKGAKHMRP